MTKAHVIRDSKLGENHSLGLQNTLYSNSLRAHIYLYMFPKTSYAPSVLHARLRSYAISRFSCHHLLLLLLLRYLLTSTSSSADFFTEGLQFRRRCARTSSDRLFLAASHYGISSMVVTEQRISESRAHAPGRGVVQCQDRPAEELSASSAFRK